MIGKRVKYLNEKYDVVEWIHYRLEWFEVELRNHNGYHRFLLRERDLEII